jgi:hypothetical protein
MRRIFGGSWFNFPPFARLAYRLGFERVNCFNDMGLRVARTPMQRMGR